MLSKPGHLWPWERALDAVNRCRPDCPGQVGFDWPLTRYTWVTWNAGYMHIPGLCWFRLSADLGIDIVTNTPGTCFTKYKLWTAAIWNRQKINNLKFLMKGLLVPWSLLRNWCHTNPRTQCLQRNMAVAMCFLSKRCSLLVTFQCVIVVTLLLNLQWWMDVFKIWHPYNYCLMCLSLKQKKTKFEARNLGLYDSWVVLMLGNQHLCFGSATS